MFRLLSRLGKTAKKAIAPQHPHLAQVLYTLNTSDSHASANDRHRVLKSLVAGSGVCRVDAAPRSPVVSVVPLATQRLPGLRNLTALAEAGAFDGLCDRPRETDRLERVLRRMEKRNAVVTGEAGTGKTALVELLARRIARGEVATALQGVQVYELRAGDLVAGTKYRGEFEQRVKDLLDKFAVMEEAVLFVDEMHLLWGAGRAEGAPMDAANMLKPVLARNQIRMIGATTTEEYQRYIAQDRALARRFQEIKVAAPAPELVFEMVRAQAGRLEQHHGVTVTNQAIHCAIELTDRYAVAQNQPDKARDLLDDTCVAVRSRGISQISEVNLLETLSEKIGLPIAQLTGDDRHQLRTLETELKRRIVGQDHAVEAVAATLIARRQGLGRELRNLGVFLFAGSTGVGKTGLARAVAEKFFGGEQALLHLDMAEYSQPTAVNKLLGAPAGYVGCEHEGTLTKWLHAHGAGVILFDETEKAHEEIWTLLLSLLDEGRIHSGKGERLDTRNCVVILTTNALTPADLQGGALGFMGGEAAPRAVDLLAKHFPSEFLGRLDEVLLFNPLGPRQLREIAALRLNEEVARLRCRGIHLVYQETLLIDYLLAQCEDFRSGARRIAEVVDRMLLRPISALLLGDDTAAKVRIELDDRFFAGGSPRLLPENQEVMNAKSDGLSAALSG